MVIHVANGNPLIATVLMTLSAFKSPGLVASFQSILLAFSSEAAAQKFVEEAKFLGCAYSKVEANNVVVVPDFGGSRHAANAVYRAVDVYKDSLISVNEFKINLSSEAENKQLEIIEQYLKEYFGSDAMTIAAPTQ